MSHDPQTKTGPGGVLILKRDRHGRILATCGRRITKKDGACIASGTEPSCPGCKVARDRV